MQNSNFYISTKRTSILLMLFCTFYIIVHSKPGVDVYAFIPILPSGSVCISMRVKISETIRTFTKIVLPLVGEE